MVIRSLLLPVTVVTQDEESVDCRQNEIAAA